MQFVRAEEYLQCAAEDVNKVANGDPLAVDLSDVVGDDDIASVDSITVEPDDLTLENGESNSTDYTHDGTTVPAGKGVLFDKSGGTAGRHYTVRIAVTLDSDPTAKRGAEVVIDVQ